MSRPRPSSTVTSPRLGPSILAWISSLAPTLPSLSDLDTATDKPKRVVEQLADLRDAVVLGEVVSQVDPTYFRQLTTAANSKALSENWVLRFNNLKRLYKLLIRYFEDVLRSSTANLLAPNLQLIAKGEEGSDEEICRLAGLILALVVQSDSRQQHVERIQSLEQWVQRELMWSIEQVIVSCRSSPSLSLTPCYNSADSEFYAMQHERSQLLNDKDAIQIVYEDLVKTHNTLKEDHEEALASLAKAEARAAEAASAVSAEKSERADQVVKAEVDRLRIDLQKAENQLGEAEAVVERQTKLLEDLTRKVDDLAPRAEEAIRLKDQMDEYRHAAEKAKKTENVLEKYRKKLEESADLRRNIKTLEDQNSSLLDKNAALEEEFTKVSAFKPLMESYKSQLDSFEAKTSSLTKENDGLRHELERARSKTARLEEEREKEREALTLYEERVKELELGERKGGKRSARADDEDEDANEFEGVGGELDDAMSGTTMTDLKLKIRKLGRELEQAKANKADASRLVVLENLLEDSNRMKKRYENEYLKEHREKLVVEGKLEEIMSGKSRLGDGPEAAMALRQRLNETVDELEALRRTHAELDVKFESQSSELTVAKSDLTLVNKDQLDILKSLRASVSVEKEALSKEVERLRVSLQSAEDKNTMQMSQVNALLVEKSSLQSDSIGQREKMLERERDMSDLRASTSGRALSEAEQARLASMEQDNKQYQKEISEMQDKLQKAKAFIKQQDKLFKEQHASEHHVRSFLGNFEEAEQGLRSQISTLTEELERQKSNNADIEARYRREQQLMLSAWHELGMRSMREGVAAAGTSGARGNHQPTSWLAQQRARSNGKGLVSRCFSSA
ncbi:HOOK protein-domain-containing protein [Leucosporidium creatinivorum]|uniref:HOOK protein-domain-containing protein n=1 Tax=Leucosporidium creatinivorum TaxID=106004 RepID=A0A1Y2FWZ3_9BASI|nr:HOOK protein-domain-containing protein [Leucosporidium creatinivorum]